eukprot:713736-Pyramimonas_sp.AAC.1
MRCDTVPPPLPRGLTTTSHHNPEPQTSNHDLEAIGLVLPYLAFNGSLSDVLLGTCSVAETMHVPPAPIGALPVMHLSANLLARYTPGSTWPQAP